MSSQLYFLALESLITAPFPRRLHLQSGLQCTSVAEGFMALEGKEKSRIICSNCNCFHTYVVQHFFARSVDCSFKPERIKIRTSFGLPVDEL